jgi:hypothetical protein
MTSRMRKLTNWRRQGLPASDKKELKIPRQALRGLFLCPQPRKVMTVLIALALLLATAAALVAHGGDWLSKGLLMASLLARETN